MKFFIHHRPVTTVRTKEFVGDLIHITTEEGNIPQDGQVWQVRRCSRPATTYTRLITMLRHGGMEEDDVYPLDGKRSVKDLVRFMNSWEGK